ncbi:unnamed protein product [Choristocarpus tenellus]
MARPYHFGFDCDGYSSYTSKAKCRFCGDAACEREVGINQDFVKNTAFCGDVVMVGWVSLLLLMDGSGDGGGPLCCNRPDCLERDGEACRKVLQCGHACHGVGEVPSPQC